MVNDIKSDDIVLSVTADYDCLIFADVIDRIGDQIMQNLLQTFSVPVDINVLVTINNKPLTAVFHQCTVCIRDLDYQFTGIYGRSGNVSCTGL